MNRDLSENIAYLIFQKGFGGLHTFKLELTCLIAWNFNHNLQQNTEKSTHYADRFILSKKPNIAIK